MESFYGGRQGASVVIKARFKYITSDKDAQDQYIDPYYRIAFNRIRETTDPESEERIAALAQLTKETMTDCLKDVNYKDVWYHEYCIIDHPNRNNKNNGKIYRRTLKKAEDVTTIGGVAEYVGQIVGPAGSAPQLADVTSVDNLQQGIQTAAMDLNADDVLSYRDENGNLVIYDSSTGASNPAMGVQNFGEDINYIPGNSCAHINISELKEISWCISEQDIGPHYSDGEIQRIYICKDCGRIKVSFATTGNCPSCEDAAKNLWRKYINQWVDPTIFLSWGTIQQDSNYTDEYVYDELDAKIQQYIQHGSYGWYNLRKGTDEQDLSLVYLGFDIPYHVNEFEGSTLPYDESVQVVKTINTETVLAPYYEKYNIKIPRGITGAWLDNLRWEEVQGITQYHQFSDIIYRKPSEDNYYVDYWDVGNNTISIEANTTIWLVDFHWTDNQGVSHTINDLYLGLYKNISDITLDDYGTLTIYYSDDPTGANKTEFNQKITWISSAEVDESDNLKVNFNNNNIANINSNLKTITGINLTNKGVLSFNRSDNSVTTMAQKIKWVDSVTFTTPTATTTDAGHLKVHFNTAGASSYAVDANLNIYKSINYEPDTGVLTLENTNSDLNLSETIRTVQEGLFVESKNYQVTVTATADFDIIENAVNNYLNGLTGNQVPDKTKAQIVTITKGSGADAETEKTIAYWNTVGQRWEILGDTTPNNGGSGNGAALDPARTNIRYDIKSMLLNTVTLSSSGTISDPWNAQSSVIYV